MGCVVAGFLLPSNVSGQVTIYENNFDDLSAGSYTDDDLDAGWNEPSFNNGVTEGRVGVVSGPDAFGGNGSSLSVLYPAGLAGARETGAQWKLEFGASFEEAVLSYRVKFADGFDFVRGGKLPGLAGGTAPTGSTQADGTNGWTGRWMWRTDFTGVSGQPEQATTFGISYAKHTTSGFNMDGRQEDRVFFEDANGQRTVFVPGQWYQITQRIKMNTVGEFDGIQQIWIDGRLVLDESDLEFRVTDQLAIDQMYFSTFFGGNDDWRTSKDEVAFFDDFVVSIPGAGSEPDPPEPPPADGPLLVPGTYPTIAQALDAAMPGDTIEISGVLVENVRVQKSVRIQGTTDALVIAEDSGTPALSVRADGVQLVGFEIQGGRYCIDVRPRLKDVQIQDLRVSEAVFDGILVVSFTEGLTILNTESRENGRDGFRILRATNASLIGNDSNRNGVNGYTLGGASDCSLEDNKSFLNQRHGFYLSGQSCSLVDNRSLQNHSQGILVVGGDGHSLVNNLSKDNGSVGISLVSSSMSELLDNRSRFNVGPGIRLWNNSNANLLDDNNCTGNQSIGIQIGRSSDNELVKNFVSGNLRNGIFLGPATTANTVSLNVLEANRSAITDRGTENVVLEDNFLR